MILSITVIVLFFCALVSWVVERTHRPVIKAMYLAFHIFQWVFTRFPRKETSHV